MSGVKGQKRSRAQYGGSIKRQKGARQLEAGMQGILITCNMNERKCVGEAYSLLNAYAEELYGPEKFSEPDQPQSENDDEDDMEAALKKEVDQIRSTTERNLRRFQSVESGANNVIFIKTHSIEPEKFVHHILKDLYTTKKKKSRVILRMLPFSGTCKAFIEDMKKYAENFFEPWFKAPKKGTFQIVYKARNNGHVEREQVIKELAGVRSASAIITWLNRRTGSSTVHLNSTQEAESFIGAEEVAVIGFFKDLQGRMANLFYEAAKDVPELAFGVVNSDDISANYGVTKNTVTVFKKGKPARYDISEADIESKLDLVRLIRSYNMDLVTEYNLEIMFILVDTNETRNGRIFEYFRITEVDVPAVRILNLTSDVKYQMPADEVDFENLRSFCQSYLDGKAKPKTDTEEIPEDWDKTPVKQLVGKNFNRVAFNKSSHAFIMFYAPWSKECQDLLPVWDELGRKYQHHHNITIGRIDCTANDIQLIVLDRYPYVRYFPAGSDTQAVRYTGEKTLEAFTEFLEQQIQSKVDQENSSESEDSAETEGENRPKEEL